MENIKQKIDRNIQAWIALGPILLALCMLTSTFSTHSTSLPFIFCGFAGLFLILQWQKQGLVIALSLLMVTAITLIFYQEILTNRIWILYDLSAMAMSLVITKLAFDESRELLSQSLMQKKTPERQITQVEEVHKTAEETWIQHRNELLKKIDTLKEEKEELIASQQQKTQQLQEEIEPQAEKTVVSLEIDQSPVQQPQSESITITETPSKIYSKEEVVPQRNYQALYQELRVQFEEKSQILNGTRKELFHTNEQVLALQKEKEEVQLAGNQPYSSALEKHIVRMDSNQKRQEKFFLEEIDTLHDLVATLLKEE